MMKIGKYEITESYANDPKKVAIHHESGEGGDFEVEALESVIDAFYKKHF